MASPTFFAEGHTAYPQDTLWRIQMKILGALNDGSSTGGSTNMDDVVDPSAAPSDTTKTWFFTNTANGSLWVWKANGVAWQQII